MNKQIAYIKKRRILISNVTFRRLGAKWAYLPL